MKEVYCKATTPPALTKAIFSGLSDPTLYVPKTAVNAYKSVRNWRVHNKGRFEYETNIVGYDF